MKRIVKNLISSLMLAGALLFATTLTASTAIVADGGVESKVEISTFLDRMDLADELDIFVQGNDQDPKKVEKTSKKGKSTNTKEVKSGECKTEVCNPCSDKEKIKKAAKKKKS